MNGTVLEVYRKVQINKNCCVMEIKKSKKASLENKKKSFFLFGLLTSLGVILMAFEWADHSVNYSLNLSETGDLLENEIVIQDIEIERPKPLKTKPVTIPPIVDTFVVDNNAPDDSTILLVTTKTPVVDPVLGIDTGMFTDPGPTIVKAPFKIVEEMPSFVGGESKLYEYLSKKIKYTQYAREAGIEGKVYISFVVEKDGRISSVKLLRGIDNGLDRNAKQSIKGMPKWKPGKQRGKAVRVQMSLPINYELH